MNIVAIDSSGLVATVAIMTEEKMVAEYTINNKKTHSQTLLPMLDEIVKASGLAKKEIDAVAISKGPGSFTGLRIGSATAKGLGLALDKPLIEVSTLMALAYNVWGAKDAVVCPIMDARRGEVYTALYEYTGEKYDTLSTIVEETAIPLTEMLQKLNETGKHVIFVGDAIPVYRNIIEQQMAVSFTFAPSHLSEQHAGSVGALALKLLFEGKTIPAAEHAPTYLRLSQAEREKQQADAKNASEPGVIKE